MLCNLLCQVAVSRAQTLHRAGAQQTPTAGVQNIYHPPSRSTAQAFPPSGAPESDLPGLRHGALLLSGSLLDSAKGSSSRKLEAGGAGGGVVPHSFSAGPQVSSGCFSLPKATQPLSCQPLLQLSSATLPQAHLLPCWESWMLRHSWLVLRSSRATLATQQCSGGSPLSLPVRACSLLFPSTARTKAKSRSLSCPHAGGRGRAVNTENKNPALVGLAWSGTERKHTENPPWQEGVSAVSE